MCKIGLVVALVGSLVLGGCFNLTQPRGPFPPNFRENVEQSLKKLQSEEALGVREERNQLVVAKCNTGDISGQEEAMLLKLEAKRAIIAHVCGVKGGTADVGQDYIASVNATRCAEFSVYPESVVCAE